MTVLAIVLIVISLLLVAGLLLSVFLDDEPKGLGSFNNTLILISLISFMAILGNIYLLTLV